MPQLPSGTVTFVFSDIEGSTALLKRLGDEGYAQALARHRTLLRETFAAHDGHEIDTQGDAFFYSFGRARAAVAAAVEVQRRHANEAWPEAGAVRLRLGLHTGEPVIGDEGYTGLDVVRASRIAATGRGGQVLLSESTRAIVVDNLPTGVTIRPLGERRLKDIERPEAVYELLIEGVVVSAAEEKLVPASELSAVDAALEGMPAWVRDAAHGVLVDGPPDADHGRQIEERVLAQIADVVSRRERR